MSPDSSEETAGEDPGTAVAKKSGTEVVRGKRCGDFGGMSNEGTLCQRDPGWGIPGATTGRCKHHITDVPAESEIFAELSDRERMFVLAYTGSAWFNATQAAKDAGYAHNSARISGHRLIHKPQVRRAIDEWCELHSGTSKEILARMAARASASLDPFIKVHEGRAFVDLAAVKEVGLLHLVKKIKQRTLETNYMAEGEIVEEVILTEVELYDAQQADRDLAKIRGLYQDNVNVNINFGQLSDRELMERIEERRKTLERLDSDLDPSKEIVSGS